MIFDYNYARRPFGLRAHNVRPYTKLCVMIDFANSAPGRRALQIGVHLRRRPGSGNRSRSCC